MNENGFYCARNVSGQLALMAWQLIVAYWAGKAAVASLRLGEATGLFFGKDTGLFLPGFSCWGFPFV
jgi:hypothetical protein